ncbi:MAG: RluA family pseudouridine synthase [Deltaproteobacteria bacterium]|nr:RluA family pseudouridine synthase [Deltaproteobacteria bacterium]
MSPPPAAVLFDEDRIVVIEKPSGVTSEQAAAAIGLRLVHRIDKGTSGLLMLARDARTVARLQRMLRAGGVERRYRFVAHGAVSPFVLDSELVRDRGDGLRGSGVGGKRSIAEILDCIVAPDQATTLGVARLITGRTHQLRIQLAEAGHPIVGERVYVRDALRSGARLLDATRLMLHAERLRFVHPGTKRAVELCAAVPAALTSVSRGGQPRGPSTRISGSR